MIRCSVSFVDYWHTSYAWDDYIVGDLGSYVLDEHPGRCFCGVG